MVLDTNAKKFKYSTFNKILCVIICLATFACSAKLITGEVMSFVYDEKPISKSSQTKDWTSTSTFRNLLGNDLNKIYEITISSSERARLKRLGEQKKDECIKQALAYKEALLKERELEGEYDGYDPYLGDYEYDLGEITLCLSLNSDDEQDLSELYDSELESRIDEAFEWGSYRIDTVSKDLNFYSALDSKVIASSLSESEEKNFDESQVKAYQRYIIIKNSKLAECKGIDEDIANTVFGWTFTNTLYKNVDIYMFFNDVDLSKNLFDYISFDDSKINSYSQLRAFDGYARDCRNMAVIYCPVATVLLLISFACAFYYFSISGKKDKDDFARLRFTDYLPLELQLLAGVGIGFGAILLAATAFEYMLYNEYSLIIVWGITLVAIVIQIAVFCIYSANARYAKSEKKYYKHLILYWIFLGLWKFLVLDFRLHKKLFKKMRASARRTSGAFRYKPLKFKKNVIALTIIYAVVNVILFAFIVLLFFIFVDTIGRLIPFILAVGDLVGNILILRRVLEYIKNLDIIINASANHEDIPLDADALPESLKVLAQSMRYTNAELQSAVTKAVKDERLRSELITNVSHDLKTPLTSIITYVDLLSKCDIQDEKAREYIGVLDDKGAKLKRLIDDLIEASKVTSGNITVNPSFMNLSELCLQATVDAQADFEKAGLELIVKQGEKPTTVFADGTKTFRIIENLLSNARKYSAVHSRVYISVYEENNCGVFEIKNISAEPLDISPDELTERFVRGDKSRNKDGNGLGLSIAKELCTLQNGTLDISIDGDLFKVKVKLPKE